MNEPACAGFRRGLAREVGIRQQRACCERARPWTQSGPFCGTDPLTRPLTTPRSTSRRYCRSPNPGQRWRHADPRSDALRRPSPLCRLQVLAQRWWWRSGLSSWPCLRTSGGLKATSLPAKSFSLGLAHNLEKPRLGILMGVATRPCSSATHSEIRSIWAARTVAKTSEVSPIYLI